MSYRAKSYLYIKQNFHSDYFSGWDETELQRVLDNCENPSEAANPDAFCSDWLTFRGKGKEEGVQTQDDEIRYGYCPVRLTNVPEVSGAGSSIETFHSA